MMEYCDPLHVDAIPRVGFRVEVIDPDSFWHNANGLRAWNPAREADHDAFHDHLTWNRARTTPFISFFTTWTAALRRRQFYLDKGITEVNIHVVYLRGTGRCVYDAILAAKLLGLHHRLPFHAEEVLVLDPQIPEATGSNPLAYHRMTTFVGEWPLQRLQIDFHEAEAPTRIWDLVWATVLGEPHHEVRVPVNVGAARSGLDALRLGMAPRFSEDSGIRDGWLLYVILALLNFDASLPKRRECEERALMLKDCEELIGQTTRLSVAH